MVPNVKVFSYLNELVRVKKFAPKRRIHLASWNICFLTGKLAELVAIYIVCVPEIK